MKVFVVYEGEHKEYKNMKIFVRRKNAQEYKEYIELFAFGDIPMWLEEVDCFDDFSLNTDKLDKFNTAVCFHCTVFPFTQPRIKSLDALTYFHTKFPVSKEHEIDFHLNKNKIIRTVYLSKVYHIGITESATDFHKRVLEDMRKELRYAWKIYK